MSIPPVHTTGLTFDDEFNTFSASPDGSTGTWMTMLPYGGEAAHTLTANHEAQYYSGDLTGSNSPFSLANGILSISASLASPGSNPYNLPYTSGIITTDKSFSQTYGYFEINAKLPSGQGFWPGFWMLPASNVYTAELDIFEVLNTRTATMHSGTIGETDGVWGTTGAYFATPDTAAGFHTFGVDWEPTITTFYLDGNILGSQSTFASMDTPMFMLLQFAVGGQGSWPGAPDPTTKFPAAMQIDYVRAYSTPGTIFVGGPASTPAQLVHAADWVAPARAPASVAVGSGPDVIALTIAEDAYLGDAQFTIGVDGQQIGGIQTATASRAAGFTQEFDIAGSFPAGVHTVTIDYLADMYNDTPGADRNLYVTGASFNGTHVDNSAVNLYNAGNQSFTFVSSTARTHTLTLAVSQDFSHWSSDYVVTLDGTPLGAAQTTLAPHRAGVADLLSFSGQWGPGPHTLGVSLASAARSLYIEAAAYDGTAVTNLPATLSSAGVTSLAVTVGAPVAHPIELHLSEDAYLGDAQFIATLDGQPLAGPTPVTAAHAAGASQAFDFSEILRSGAHDLAISFINNLSGGSAALDRNLYVDEIDFDGRTLPGAAAPLYGNQTVHFTLPVPE